MGTQYRSAIFFHSPKQEQVAKESKEKLEKEGVYQEPIVTQIVPFTTFYKAEGYHQDYFDRNQEYPYCQFVINPKIKKLYKDFKDELKDEYKADVSKV